MAIKDASVSMLAMINSVQVFGATLPGFADARDKMLAADGTIRGDVRSGEAVAALLSLTFGAVASSMSDDPRPLLFSAVVTAGFVLTYEWMLRQPQTSGSSSQVTA